jgi:lambda repressor-like predicted transcriptional regulator
MAQRKILPDDLAERIEQGMSIADLARHYEWSRDTMRAVLKRDAPELAIMAVANGREVQRIMGKLNTEKVNKKRAITRRRDRSNEPFMDLSKEKLVAKVTQAVRHLQRQRLGPCYPWKDGYYWMGKCMDADAIMAEATKRGWNDER